MEKIQLSEDGEYILRTSDPSIPILLELQDSSKVRYDSGKFTIPFKGFEDNQTIRKELSILSAMVDKGFLSKNDTIKIKNINSVEKFYKYLLLALTDNYNKLRDNNMRAVDAMYHDLKFMAERLIELDISTTLPDRLDGCNDNDKCIENILYKEYSGIKMTKEEAYLIAQANRKVELVNDGLVKSFRCPK